MKADDIVDQLLGDNDTFRKSFDADFFRSHKDKQTPLVTMVTCSDSRVQPQVISRNPINQIFVIRNIGNQLSTAAGSVDYGIFHLKTPLLLILGHANCGAINAFLAGYDDESVAIKRELNQLPLAIKEARGNIIACIASNIHFQVDMAVTRYKHLVHDGQLTVAGAYYDFADGLKKGMGKLIMVNFNGERQF